MNLERMNSESLCQQSFFDIYFLPPPGSISPHHPACTVIHSRAVTFLLTKMRDKDLPTKEFQMVGKVRNDQIRRGQLIAVFLSAGWSTDAHFGRRGPGKAAHRGSRKGRKSEEIETLCVKESLPQVISPCGEVEGLVDAPGPPVCVVSIVRSGDILQVHRFGLSFYVKTRHTQEDI